jgi:hypothetical protein
VDQNGHDAVQFSEKEYSPSIHDFIGRPADADPNIFRESNKFPERTVIQRRGGKMERYTPPKNLCHILRNWSDTEEGAIEFANQYGLLGYGYWQLTDAPENQTKNENQKSKTLNPDREPINGFVRLQRFMSYVLDQVDEALETEHHSTIEGTRDPSSLVERMSSMADFINKWVFPSFSLRLVRVEMGKNVNHQTCFVPNTLADFIEASLIEEVAAALTIRYCLICGDPFVIGKNRGRSHKKTCSNKCRVARFRKESST